VVPGMSDALLIQMSAGPEYLARVYVPGFGFLNGEGQSAPSENNR
jgi:hypothetical protein